MAYGANYGYNPYISPYMTPYTTQQMIQPTQPQNNGGFVWVNDINEAANYMVAPNSAVQLWDKNNPCVYLKTADAAGKPTMQIFDLVERKAQNPSQHVSDGAGDFVLREEFNELKSRVEALAVKKSTKVKVIREDDDE